MLSSRRRIAVFSRGGLACPSLCAAVNQYVYRVTNLLALRALSARFPLTAVLTLVSRRRQQPIFSVRNGILLEPLPFRIPRLSRCITCDGTVRDPGPNFVDPRRN